MALAPYESAITAGFTFLGEVSGFLEKLSPAIIEWIQASIPLEKQRKIDRRVRKCKLICRKKDLPYIYICKQVDVDFLDLTSELRQEISDLISFELLKKQ